MSIWWTFLERTDTRANRKHQLYSYSSQLTIFGTKPLLIPSIQFQPKIISGILNYTGILISGILNYTGILICGILDLGSWILNYIFPFLPNNTGFINDLKVKIMVKWGNFVCHIPKKTKTILLFLRYSPKHSLKKATCQILLFYCKYQSCY